LLSLQETLKDEKRSASPDEILDVMHVLNQTIPLKDFKGQGTCLQIIIDSLKLTDD
jgi:hypothetical protein